MSSKEDPKLDELRSDIKEYLKEMNIPKFKFAFWSQLTPSELTRFLNGSTPIAIIPNTIFRMKVLISERGNLRNTNGFGYLLDTIILETAKLTGLNTLEVVEKFKSGLGHPSLY